MTTLTNRRAGRAIATVVFSVLLLALALPARAEVKVGDKPQFQVKLLNGQTLNAKDLAGRIGIVEFWATWCPPCRKSVPHLKKMHEEYAPKGVVMISISLDDRAATARSFIEDNGMDWLQAVDSEQRRGELAKQFGVSSIPNAFVLSPEGEVLWRGHPGNLERAIKSALEEHPPTKGLGDPIEERKEAEAAQEREDNDIQGAIDELVKARNGLKQKEPDFETLLAAAAKISTTEEESPMVRSNLRVLARYVRIARQKSEDAYLAARKANPEAAERLDELVPTAKVD